MKLRWLGHSCFKITLDNGRVLVTDPFDATVGYPPLQVVADVTLSSHGHFDHNCFDALQGDFRIIDRPGTYDCYGARITGVHSFHDDVRGAKRGDNTIFAIEADGVKIVHLGDLGHLPDTKEQDDLIRGADVLLIPIGGTFTITTPQAVELIGRFAPRCAIAMHFKNRFCGFPVADSREVMRLTGAGTLDNTIDLSAEVPAGCFVMDI